MREREMRLRRGVVREREQINHDVREKPKGSARVMRELSAERGGREHRAMRGLPREREREKILVKFF
jgi:hypothetical protein